jgi:RNA polymerase sigma factor (sigma-70 family)
MSLDCDSTDLTNSYLVGSFRHRRNPASLVLRASELLDAIDRDNPGLRRRIEVGLSNPTTFKNSHDHQLLRMTVETVNADTSVAAIHSRETPLGERDIPCDPSRSDPALVIEKKELREILDAAIDQLPDLPREVMSLVVNEGLKQAEVARRLDIDRRRVHENYQEALSTIADVIERRRCRAR